MLFRSFTVQEEKSRAISIITGTLNPTLTSTDSAFANNQIVVPKSTTKEITIKLTNNNNRDAKFNFYYIGNLPTGVEVGYISTTKDIPPTTEGTVIQKGKSQEYTIKIKNTNSSSFTLQIGSDGGLFDKDLLFPSNGHFFEEVRKTAVETVLAKVNQETLDYQTASTEQQKEAWTFSHTAGSQQTGWTSEELKDYRYIGNNPNNYIIFNNETWRIIGVFTAEDALGTRKKYIKLLRNESLLDEAFSWDSTSPNTTNEWSTSDLRKLLNPGYESEDAGGSLYYVSHTGQCRQSRDLLFDCDFKENGLKEESREQIAEVKWYLGSVKDDNNSALGFYQEERGVNVYSGNSINWIGKVGLIYPSDYAYTFANGFNST